MAIGWLARPGTFKGDAILPAVEIANGFVPAWKRNDSLWADAAGARDAGIQGFECRVFAAADINVSEYDENGMPDMLEIYVVPKGYNEGRFGLLYTDVTFERGVNQLLKDHNFPVKISSRRTVGYTEQGMQGQNFVSMVTVDAKFIKDVVSKYADKLGIDVEAKKEQAAAAKKIVDVAIRDIKNIKIGARHVKTYGASWHSVFKFNDLTIATVASRLRKLGWRPYRQGNKHAVYLAKDGAAVSIVRPVNQAYGPRSAMRPLIHIHPEE